MYHHSSSNFAKGLLKVMPILAGIIVGYGLSLAFGIVDFAVVTAASWIAIPKFVAPEFNWHAIAFMILLPLRLRLNISVISWRFLMSLVRIL